MYDEKKTQKTSYKRSPVSSKVETFRLGRRTNAMNATHNPIPIAGTNIQEKNWGEKKKNTVKPRLKKSNSGKCRNEGNKGDKTNHP